MRINAELLSFNRGLMSRYGLARTDLKRTGMSAEVMTNWVPRVLGSMTLRPGLAYTGGTLNDNPAVHIPFVFSNSDTALIEVTNFALRFRVNEEIVSRPTVNTSITNGAFNTDLTGWTDADEAGADSAWETGGYMRLTGTGTNAAVRTQAVTVLPANIGVEHALRVEVFRGPVTLRVGTSATDDSYIRETTLGTGIHSITFTPVGNFTVRLSNALIRSAFVDTVGIGVPGDLVLPAPWPTAALGLLRWDQSGDIVYVACDGYQQRKIERRGPRSWSITRYEPTSGPFRADNTGPTTLTPSAQSGNITLTASAPVFRTGHVGALFRIESQGQRVTAAFSSANAFSGPIRVTGAGTSRIFTLIITGTFTATVTLQRSVGDLGNWEDVTSFTTPQNRTFDDELPNQIVYYRLGVKTGAYTSGTANIILVYSLGSITGVARVTAVASATSASAEVVTELGGVSATAVWAEGAWSDVRGWPTCVALYEGRLWWAGRDKIWGSQSDAFEGFDAETEGDSGPISRSIGQGPVDTINWLLPLQRLVLGTQGAECSARSTAFDEPLTPTNFNIKQPSTQGSAPVPAAKIDARAVFVQKAGKKLFLLEFDGVNSQDYASADLSVLAFDESAPAISRVAVQRQPGTRVHCVRADGTAAVLVFDPAEDVKCWVEVETDGAIEDAFVLPGDEEDRVYYLVARTIGGQTKRYLERWALESQCRGGALNRQADSHVIYSGAPSDVLSLPHLAGESVVVWADGRDLGTFTVDNGVVVLPDAVSNAVAGLPYAARFKGTKLAYGAALGSALTQRKRVHGLGLILADTHYQGLRYGPSFDVMDDLPLIEQGAVVAADTVWESYDEDAVEFPGEWDTDARVCLEAAAPRPCTVLAAVIGMETHDK